MKFVAGIVFFVLAFLWSIQVNKIVQKHQTNGSHWTLLDPFKATFLGHLLVVKLGFD